ncbi:lipoyl(octanoyl) transferase LipB [Isoptericola chiayiensis]|uniref:Octanoyltransferase n=1 Tax=Isoptericola chiayiensis TaxID=579446 RepID=A0ABP8YFJ8_9MICO|nr:lipoyl(octanoyl) transferase LipB [Isoptericola chiayiensis]NOW00257.1 lipoyl(octanoyl) transferase [Isoptericola chiayiensis]
MDVVTLDGLTDYHEAWELQRAVHDAVHRGERADTLLLVEHPDVYTAGRRTRRDERPDDGTPVVDVDRGGKITWHGPGQQVVYPIVRLAEPVDVVAYVRALEQAVMSVCDGLGLTTGRVEDRSGVWLPADPPSSGTPTPPRRARKVCAVGVRVAKGVTMHGLALNCDPDLSRFDHIVPCGITDADVTSLSAETGRTVTPSDVAAPLVSALHRDLAPLRAHPTADVVHLTSTGRDRSGEPAPARVS